MTSRRQALEVDRNYAAFERVLSEILPDHRDQLALMRDQRIVGFFDQPREALHAACELFPDGIYSIQEVTDKPIDLGYWSHVGCNASDDENTRHSRESGSPDGGGDTQMSSGFPLSRE